MRYREWISLVVLIGGSSVAEAQRGPSQKGPVGVSQLAIGEEGVVWYSRWDDAVKEAKRSNRPIFFMAAACQARNVSGVF